MMMVSSPSGLTHITRRVIQQQRKTIVVAA